MPTLPPLLHTRSISLAVRFGLGANMQPKVETTASKLPSANGRSSTSASRNSMSSRSAAARSRPRVEQCFDIVGGDHFAPAACGGQRHVAVAGGHVEHALRRAQVHRLAQRLADDLQRGADDGIVARRPGGALARLDGGEIGLRGGGSGSRQCVHEGDSGDSVWGSPRGAGRSAARDVGGAAAVVRHCSAFAWYPAWKPSWNLAWNRSRPLRAGALLKPCRPAPPQTRR